MTDFTPEEPKPISVKANAAPVVMSEGTKAVGTAAFAIITYQFIKSDVVLGVVVGASGFVLTFLWGLWHRIRSWGALRYLASLADDKTAVVNHKPWWHVW